jgi:hypothetical protein
MKLFYDPILQCHYIAMQLDMGNITRTLYLKNYMNQRTNIIETHLNRHKLIYTIFPEGYLIP